MKRAMMQAYVIGSAEAVDIYRRAFDAELISSYLNSDGSYYHSELDIAGNVLAVAEANSIYAIDQGRAVTGNVMHFCFEFGEGGEEKLRQAYQLLQQGAQIIQPLQACEYSPLMVDLIDRFGIRWGLFV